MFRQALKNCLNSIDDFEVVYESMCGAELESYFHPEKIDIILLDLRLKGQHGAITCQNIRRKFPEAKIIIISMYNDPEIILAMCRYGACAFISKEQDLEYIEHTIRMVLKFGFYFDKDLGEMMLMEMNKAYKKSFIESEYRTDFSETEMRIVVMACTGLTNEQIAEELKLSKRSVENHRTNLQLKTDSKNFQGVLIYMFKHYLLFPQQF